MRGFYVYCITSEDGPKKFSGLNGIDNKSGVFTLAYKDLGAIVSMINLSDFGGNELKKKLDDPKCKWVKRTVLNHQKVINKVMKGRAVIPMRFGIVYKKKGQIEEVLEKNYRKFKNILGSLVDKKEWGVKIFCDQGRLASKIQAKDGSIKKLRKQLGTGPEGKKFFLQKKLDAITESRMEEEMNKYSQIFLKRLSKDSDKYILNDTSSKELTGRNEEMIINVAYLVADKNLVKFEKNLDELREKYLGDRFLLELSGPWPPYNFVNLDYDRPKQIN